MDRREFSRRRRELMRRMGADAVAVFSTAPLRRRNRDVAWPFRPDSDFWYLTGFPEPDAVAVLLAPTQPGGDGQYLLFCRRREPQQALWDGERIGIEGATADYGADLAWPIDELKTRLPALLAGRRRLWRLPRPQGDADPVDDHLLRAGAQLRERADAAPHELLPLAAPLHDMRLRKSPAEIDALRRAAGITVAAHKRAMRACRPGVTECALEGELLYEFHRHGARHVAYNSIVGGGANACTLHYTRNADRLEAQTLALIDAGVEWEHYAADVTRTFPVSGRFTAPQRALYEIVLAAQQAAIDAIRPGVAWDAPHRAAVRAITGGLVEVGLLAGEVDALIGREAARKFYPHRTSHWLGLDVHDVGDYSVDNAPRLFEPGMALTVEPGLYIPAQMEGVDSRWRGIGIRIEDDVVVTPTGCEVLTAGAPKSPDAIEAWMAGGVDDAA